MDNITDLDPLLSKDGKATHQSGYTLSQAKLPSRFSEVQKDNNDFVDEDVAAIRISNTQCLMHLLKGMIGTGILAMPVAYKNGGLWVSFAIVFVLGIANTWCMHLLVRSSIEMTRKTGKTHMDYATVVELAFETRGGLLSRFSKLARWLVNSFIIITQFGFCCVYSVFLAQNLSQVFELIGVRLSDRIYILIISVLFSLYVTIRSINTLASFSALANVINIFGIFIVLAAVIQGGQNVDKFEAFAGFSNLPLFFGQVLFAFEGIALVMPLWNKMEDQHAFTEKTGVLNLGMTIAIVLYQAVGFYGYLKFGNDVEGSITLNLPNDNGWFVAVKAMFSVSMFLTYGIQYYVPINVVWPGIIKKCQSKNIQVSGAMEFVFRIALVWVIAGLSALVPHLDLLISLSGAFATSMLTLIFPVVTQLIAFRCSYRTWVVNSLILTIGLLGFVIGTYSSLLEIIRAF